MADTKISALTDGAPAVSTDIIPVARGAANRRVTVGDVVSAANTLAAVQAMSAGQKTSTNAALAGYLGVHASVAALETAYPAASNTGASAFVGASAPYWNAVSNGSEWVLSAATVFNSGTAIGIPCSGTVGDNGALDLGSSIMPMSFTNGLYLYFPAGALYNTSTTPPAASNSPAGFYWVVMTDARYGTVYNNTYTIGNELEPPSSNTAITDKGPGAYTTTTGEGSATRYIAQATVPGGILGKNGAVTWEWTATHNNSATLKIYKPRIATSWAGSFNGSTNVTFFGMSRISNVGKQTAQMYAGGSATYGVTGAASSYLTVDTSADFTVGMSICLNSAATDVQIVTGLTIRVYPKQ